MIKFNDFLVVDKPEKTKVKFNMNAGNTTKPAWEYLRDDDSEWIIMNSWKTMHANNNLNKAGFLLAFAQYHPYGPNYYIFGGMYQVEKKEPEVYKQVGYKLTLMDNFIEYRKRLIIKLERPIGRDIYNKLYPTVQRDFNPEIYELAPSTKLGAFPGYSNVLLKHQDLRSIFVHEAPEWKNVLSNVKGIYCITDSTNGELYIGSAYGDVGGIWQRWSAYSNINDLTGGNKTFDKLKKMGAGRLIKYFTYSIIEIFDMRTKKEDIINREEYWKRVFQTVKYGMNN
jgi:hypothetical protein